MIHALSLLLLCCSCFALTNNELSMIATRYGTDKGPLGHNYTCVYSLFFSPLKNNPIALLEIGFYQGASIALWDAYFIHPQTRIYAIDFDDTYFNRIVSCSNRCSVHRIDQENPVQLHMFIDTMCNAFDVIIDDGGHSMRQQITSFTVLFPYVKPGGIYIIEDLHTSYWHEYGSSGSLEEPAASAHSTIRFLQALVDDINFVGARTSCADKEKATPALRNTLSDYQKNIKAIHFYSSLCIIEKM